MTRGFLNEDSLDPALETLEFGAILQIVALEARSEPGRACLLRRRPGRDFAECELGQSRLAEMVRHNSSDGLLPLSGLSSVTELFNSETVPELEESWRALRACQAAQVVREAFLRDDGYPHLRELAETIDDLSPVIDAVGKFFTRDGKLREDASPELRSLRSKIIAKRAAIQKTLQGLMHAHPDAIQDEIITIRGDRYCIPVRADRRSDVQGILHERSGSGASFFVEPLSIVEPNNELADLLIHEREEIARIMRMIGQKLFDFAGPIQSAVRTAGEFDAIQACAVVFVSLDGSRPEFSTSGELRLVDGRHPLLDQRLADLRESAFGEQPRGVAIVPTSFNLGGGRSALLISGPNAGGKTVALKTAGLVVAMAMSGLPVPAGEGTIIPIVDRLCVLIGDDQDVLEHRSTYSAYLLRLKSIMRLATKRSLALIDELGSGTDPEEGAALSAAVIEHFLETGCPLVVTTHIGALKSFALTDSRVENAAMEFDVESGLPTFRLIPGVPGRSRAIETAERIGLPATIIASAREKLGGRYGDMDRLIRELQQRTDEMLAARDELRVKNESLDAQLADLQQRLDDTKRERAKLAETYRDEIEALKREVRSKVADELKAIRAMDVKQREKLRPDGVSAELTRALEQRASALPSSDRTLVAGDKVRHRTLGIEGEVREISGNKVTIRAGSKKMQVSASDLAFVEGVRRESAASDRPRSRDDISEAPEAEAELNLVGFRVEDAIEEADRFIDKALLAGRKAVRLIHGFGTGTLRRALRDHLRTHPGVRAQRPGGEREGGDGATIATLDV
ncbi:MAG: Smr/MutS family protein [Thermoanaerobaculia bacterium]|nr:Smr/MutS family protein [Thermoanaerobaculia bacterium]